MKQELKTLNKTLTDSNKQTHKLASISIAVSVVNIIVLTSLALYMITG